MRLCGISNAYWMMALSVTLMVRKLPLLEEL
jgi:hypothetical protein